MKSPHSSPDRPRPLYRDPNLQIVFAATLVNVLGITGIAPALPDIMRDLGVSPDAIGLLTAVYSLPGVAFIPLSGVIADRVGRKKLLVPSLLLFGLAGTACAFAPDYGLLLGLRFLQGIGGAPLFTLCLTLISDLYAGERCTTAMGYDASFVNIGGTAFPALGGALTMLGWRYAFLVSVAALPVALFALMALESPEPSRNRRLREYLGGVARSARSRRFLVLSLAAVATFLVLMGTHFTYFPLLISGSFGAPSLVVGLIMASMSAVGALTSSQLGRMGRYLTSGRMLQMSFALMALALVLIPLAGQIWLLLVPTVIFGVGWGLNDPSRNALYAEMAPGEHRGAYMSLTQTVVRVGHASGPMVMALVFVAGGMGGTFYAGAVISAAMCALTILAVK